MIRNSEFTIGDNPKIFSGRPQRSTRQSLNARFDKEICVDNEIIVKEDSCQLSQSLANWCDSFSSSLPSVNPRKALRSGAEKISQTLNNMRTTFGTLSQKLRKSTRRRQPLKNVDSPKTPVTPYTRTRNLLGHTPTKLYSPFSIETPSGKENARLRSINKRTSPLKSSRVNMKKKMKKQKEGTSSKTSTSTCYSLGTKFSNDLVQTQIGMYEFQLTANKIIQNRLKE